jgi:hypothetical protein
MCDYGITTAIYAAACDLNHMKLEVTTRGHEKKRKSEKSHPNCETLAQKEMPVLTALSSKERRKNE